ncbi:MAG: ComF family protein, partial [Treponema sp.]|nr:ComF family protein [Treponema sp.]
MFFNCSSCGEKYFSFEDNVKRCSVCGKILVSEEDKCTRCKTEPLLFHTNKVFPLFSYRLWNKDLLFKWKMTGERHFALFFSKIIYKALKKFFPDCIVVPVPPRKEKIRKKGWDQIEDVCFYLEHFFDVKVARLLYRSSSQEQKQLNREKRL